eukprot:9494450-Pyramimonas_sp.AAC.1
MGQFWTSSTPLKWRKNLYKGYVLNAVLSGMEVLAHSHGPLRESDTSSIESFVARHARVVLRGVAWTDSSGQTRSSSNLEVLAKFRIPPIFLELRVRRLKWLQDLFEYPDTSAQILSVVFGELHVGSYSQQVFQDVPESKLNPWARQWLEDIRAVQVFDDGMVLLENHNMSPVEVLLHGREDF